MWTTRLLMYSITSSAIFPIYISMIQEMPLRKFGSCADPVMTNKQYLLDIFSSIDGITNRRYMYIGYIDLHCACRCSGAIKVGLCADPVTTNKQCLLDIFFSFIDGITNRRYMTVSCIALHIPCHVNLNKLFVFIYWFMNQKESTGTIPIETLVSFLISRLYITNKYNSVPEICATWNTRNYLNPLND